MRDGGGTASFTVDFVPTLRAGQRVALVLGQQEYAPEAVRAAGHRRSSFVIPNAPVSPPDAWLARLRIDGIESPIIDRRSEPPAMPTFLHQRIEIT